MDAGPLAELRNVGDWLQLPSQWSTSSGGPVFRDRQAWMSVASGNDDVVHVARLASLGDDHGPFPALLESFALGLRPDPLVIHHVLDIGAHVSLQQLAERAAPTSLAIALRVALAVATAAHQLWRDAEVVLVDDVVVDFNGRVLIRPSVGRRGGDVRPAIEGVGALLPGVVTAGAPREVLAQLRAQATKTPPADAAELAGVVRGLFADEHQRARELVEQLALVDVAALRG